MMELPRSIYDTWLAVAQKYAHLHRSANDDDRRLATKYGVATIRARHTDGSGTVNDGARYCCKTEHNTPSNWWAAQSKDALAFVPEGTVDHGRLARMDMFDMINGGSRATNPHPVTSHNHEENPPNDEAYILVPEAHDYLDDGGNVEPPPAGQTHRYDGGGNDTNVCDECGLSRFDAVHAIPQSKVPHDYDGGEQDTGLCDICQTDRENTLHKGGTTEPPPSTNLEQRVTALEAAVVDLQSRVTTLEESEGASLSEARVRLIVREELSKLAVDVDVKPAGTSVLRHDHGVTAMLTYEGSELKTKTRRADVALKDNDSKES